MEYERAEGRDKLIPDFLDSRFKKRRLGMIATGVYTMEAARSKAKVCRLEVR